MKETKSTPATGIRELVTAVKAQMSGLGYSQYTIDRMDAVWKNLASYCEEHNDGLLTAESARALSGICMALSWAKRTHHRTSTGPSTYCWTSNSSA